MTLTALPWLPPPADDFRLQVKAARTVSHSRAKEIRQLSTASLNLTQLHTLSKAIPLRAESPELAWLKLSMLSNATTDLLLPAIRATAPRHDLWIDIEAAPFGSFVAEALNPESVTNCRRNDVVVLALDYRAFDFHPCPGNQPLAEEVVGVAYATVCQLAQSLQTASEALVIVQTLAPPATSIFGNLDGQLPGTLSWMIARFNQRLRAPRAPGVLLLDIANTAAAVGLESWHDPVQWSVGKFPFAHAVVPLYAEMLCRLIMASKGKAKKCLVLDLDNTLWGGVIGDDGLEGIVIGQGSATGEAFLAVQQTALALRARGIILAVSSKNDESVARQVFREHPDMLLREEHISVFQANWNDKASNLKAIAATLQIGVDSLVFLDDNPAERQQVRLALPEVGVPELPDSPEYFPAMLLGGGYFEAIHYTAEDASRATQYQANAARSAVLGATSDMGAYLESLAMVAHISPIDPIGRARITQLINKTNQFNLTTKRYGEAEVALMENDPGVFGIQIRLKDRFGDNGMVSVVICRADENAWVIDTWLMSCRVLNRQLEERVLEVLHAFAATRGVERLIGRFCQTDKNSMVKPHYEKLGFTLVVQDDEGAMWTQNVADYVPRPIPIVVTLGSEFNLPLTNEAAEKYMISMLPIVLPAHI